MKPTPLLDLADRLNWEIAFAQGLAVAIHGLECEIEDQHTGTEALAKAHIERLQQIGDQLDQIILATATRKQTPRRQ